MRWEKPDVIIPTDAAPRRRRDQEQTDDHDPGEDDPCAAPVDPTRQYIEHRDIVSGTESAFANAGREPSGATEE
jgi:hypothetical protein